MAKLSAWVTTGLVLATLQLACTTDWAKTQYDEYRQRAHGLDTHTVIAGLKQALELGTQRSVAILSQTNGYLKNPEVRIPLPDELHNIAALLRKIGAHRHADEFVVSLNRAAEAAAPRARSVFINVIRSMTIEDAVGLLRGPDNAATQYFRRHSETELTAAFRPIVALATDQVGVTARYKQLLKAAGRIDVIDLRNLDLDNYVTRKALDGLYFMIAQEEKRIRQDPVARSTALLKKVFG